MKTFHMNLIVFLHLQLHTYQLILIQYTKLSIQGTNNEHKLHFSTTFRNLSKTDMAITTHRNEDWGSSYREKSSYTIRIWYTYPNGLGINPTSAKSHSTFSFLHHRSHADIISLAETNLNWSLLQYKSRLNNRIRSFHREFYAVTSNNKHEQHSKTPRGGTCTFAVNQITYRTHRSGNGEIGMDRWS